MPSPVAMVENAQQASPAPLGNGNSTQQAALASIIEAMKNAVPFDTTGVQKLRFLLDDEANTGEVVQCIDENQNDITFCVHGTIRSRRSLAIAPQFVTSARRGLNVLVDRCSCSAILSHSSADKIANAREVLISMFENDELPMIVALKMGMRDSEKDFKQNPIPTSFPALFSGTSVSFSMSRFVGRRNTGIPLQAHQLPPHPAGLPSKQELNEARVKIPESFELLPLIPIFNKTMDDNYELVNGRLVTVPPYWDATLYFRIKQDAMRFFRANSAEPFEKISLEPSPISILLQERNDETESAVCKLKKQRVMSF